MGHIVHTLIAVQYFAHVVGIQVFISFFFFRLKFFGMIKICCRTEFEGIRSFGSLGFAPRQKSRGQTAGAKENKKCFGQKWHNRIQK
jgi:hypothetical protein